MEVPFWRGAEATAAALRAPPEDQVHLSVRAGGPAELDNVVRGAHPGAPVVVHRDVETHGPVTVEDLGRVEPPFDNEVGQNSSPSTIAGDVPHDPLHAEDDFGLETLHVDLRDVEGAPANSRRPDTGTTRS